MEISDLSLQPLVPCKRSQQYYNAAAIRPLGHFENLNFHCQCTTASYLPTANSKLLKIANQAASTLCSKDNKETLSTSSHCVFASDFCHERKSALRHMKFISDVVQEEPDG